MDKYIQIIKFIHYINKVYTVYTYVHKNEYNDISYKIIPKSLTEKLIAFWFIPSSEDDSNMVLISSIT